MSRSSFSVSGKGTGIELEDGVTKQEEAGVGQPLKETSTTRTVNELTFSFFMTMLGLSMTFVIAEATPLFLITVFTIIAFDFDASGYTIWILVSQLIAIAAISPFVGTFSDLFGRKAIILVSLCLTVLGMIVIGTTPNIAGFLAGQVISGLAIGIQLLTTIAAVTELVPTSRRGAALAYIVCGFIPFAPAPLYGQYIASYNWRYITILIGGWAAIAFVVLAIFYRPPPISNAVGLTNRDLLARIDYLGSFLSIVGLVLFLTGLNWGGQDYAWSSTPVISTLTLGLAFFIAFFLWETYGAKYPMFPSRLADSPKLFAAVCVLCLTSGINYIPVVVFWVIQCYTVYGASYQQTGIYLLPLGFCIAGGAITSAVLVSAFPKRIHVILTAFCVCQTIGLGCMAAVDPENINTVWAPLTIGLFGVGGVLLPSQVIFSIITPNDLLGTGVALSVLVRLIGQVVGVSMFYNIFLQRVTKSAYENFATPAITAGIYDIEVIEALVSILAAGPLSSHVDLFPQIDTPEKLASIVLAGHETYKGSFPILYYISIAFGGAAIITSLFLKDLEKYMNNHVAVML